jgi:hypothetical protein
LRPKKAKEFIPIVSKKIELEDSLVEDVILFYWKEIRKNLSSLTHVRVHLTNLGDFTIKHWKVDEKIESLTIFKNKNEEEDRQKINERCKVDSSLVELNNIKQVIEEENQRKTFIKLHKKTTTNEPEKKYNKDLEEQGTDNRGDKE